MRRVNAMAVKVLLNTVADDALLEALTPDHIIVAAGSTPIVPTFLPAMKRPATPSTPTSTPRRP